MDTHLKAVVLLTQPWVHSRQKGGWSSEKPTCWILSKLLTFWQGLEIYMELTILFLLLETQCISHGLFQGAAFLPPCPHLHAGVWFVFYFVRTQSSLLFFPVPLKRSPHSVSTGDSFAIRTARPGGRILGYDVGYLFPDPKVVIGSMYHLEQINCTLFQVCIPKLGVISPPYLIKVPRG